MRRIRSHRASRSVPLTLSCEILLCEPQEALGEATIPRGWRAAVPGPDSCDETTCRVPTLQASALKKFGTDPPPAAYATRGGFWFVSQLLACVFAASDYTRPSFTLIVAQALTSTERRDASPRQSPCGGGGPTASAAAASRHTYSTRRLVPGGAGGDQGPSVFALCRVLVPCPGHAGATRRSYVLLGGQ